MDLQNPHYLYGIIVDQLFTVLCVLIEHLLCEKPAIDVIDRVSLFQSVWEFLFVASNLIYKQNTYTDDILDTSMYECTHSTTHVYHTLHTLTAHTLTQAHTHMHSLTTYTHTHTHTKHTHTNTPCKVII